MGDSIVRYMCIKGYMKDDKGEFDYYQVLPCYCYGLIYGHHEVFAI